MKKPFVLTWWDDKTESAISQGCSSYEQAIIKKAQIERRTGNPVHLKIK